MTKSNYDMKNTESCNNIAHGINAHVMAGNQNIALGINANVAVGEGNIALGHNAHVIDPAGNENTAIGRNSRVLAGSNSIAIGSAARIENSASFRNIAIGNSTRVEAGEDNVAVCNWAFVTAGNRNTAIGHGAHVTAGSRNIVLGDHARVEGNATNDNTVVGRNAHVTAGGLNTVLGENARVEGTADLSNVAIGHHAHITTGRRNMAFGQGARVIAGISNTVLGDHARVEGTADFANIALGYHARVTAGATNTALGADARVTAANSQGSVAIGRSANVTHTAAAFLTPNNGGALRSSTANNQILLGYSGITPTAFAALSNISDQRDKTDVSELKYDSLNFINALQPKQYRTDFRSDYVRYEEITDAEYEKLNKYTQLHEVSDVQVFGIEGSDIEWIEDEVFANQEEADSDVMTLSRERSSETATDRYTTKFISNFAKSREAALEEFKKLKPQQAKAFSASINDTEANIEELDLDTSIESLIKETRKTKFLRVFVEPDGTKAGKRYHNGFLAQQVEQAAKDMGFDFAGVKYMAHNKDENGVPEGDDQYSLQYEQLIAPLVGAVQQLSDKNDALENRNNKLEERLQKLEEALSSR